MQMSRKFLTGIILNEFTFSCLCLKHSRLCAVLWLKNVSDGFPLEVNQQMFKWTSSFRPRRILQSSVVAELLSKSPCWTEQAFSRLTLSFSLQLNLACMSGNFGLFCSFSPKLPRIHVQMQIIQRSLKRAITLK